MYDGYQIQEVFDDINESKELQAYNTMTSLLNDAFSSCIRLAKDIDKANARRSYRTDDLPQGILTPKYLSDEFTRLIPEANKTKVKEVFKQVLIVSWILALERYPTELRIPKIGSDFDATWMDPDSQVAIKARQPNQKITAVRCPSLWMDSIMCTKAKVFV